MAGDCNREAGCSAPLDGGGRDAVAGEATCVQFVCPHRRECPCCFAASDSAPPALRATSPPKRGRISASRRIWTLQRVAGERMGMRQDFVHFADVFRMGRVWVVAQEPAAGRAGEADRIEAAGGLRVAGGNCGAARLQPCKAASLARQVVEGGGKGRDAVDKARGADAVVGRRRRRQRWGSMMPGNMMRGAACGGTVRRRGGPIWRGGSESGNAGMRGVASGSDGAPPSPFAPWATADRPRCASLARAVPLPGVNLTARPSLR